MFNEQEIQMLMDGLDALIENEKNKHSMTSLIGSIMLKPEDRDEFAAEQEAKQLARQAEERALAERIILLKAQLIHLKDKSVAEGLYGGAQ
jgi:hypothetical protein